MTSGLTPRMAQCLQAIRKLSEKGYAPSISELQAELGDTNRGSLHAMLCDLRDRGAVTWTPKSRRSLRVVERPSRADLRRLTDSDLRAVMNDAIDILNRRCDAEVRA